MVFWNNKKIKLKDMKNIEASMWNLINNPGRIAIPILIKSLKDMVVVELNGLKQLEEDEKVKLGLLNKSQKVEELERELIEINQLLQKQLEILNAQDIKNMSEDEIRKHLQGNSSELSEFSMKIRKALEIVEEDFKSLNKPKENRFIVKKDTIYDTKTKITWDRDLSKNGQIKWDNAMKFAKDQGKELPTREDFWNLTHEIGSYKKTDEIQKGYPKQEYMKEIGFLNPKWSWTCDEYNKDYAFYVNLSSDDSNYYDKTDYYYVACLRRN